MRFDNLYYMNFSTWLNESILSGRTAYHGTNQIIKQFDKNFFGQRDYGDFGMGVYLSSSERLALNYAYDAAKRGGKPIVLSIRMNVSKTANFDDADFVNKVAKATNAPFPKIIAAGNNQSRPKEEAENITRFLISLRYDSAVGRNGKEIVVYDPSKLSIEGYYDENGEWNEIH